MVVLPLLSPSWLVAGAGAAAGPEAREGTRPPRCRYRLDAGVLPSEQSNLIGLSKFSRIADWIMSRPQIQEEAVMQLADLLEARLKPEGLAIVIEADHLCTHWRGVKDESHMTNSVMRGAFLTNPESRKEFLQLTRG